MFRPLSGRADLTFVEYERDWGEGLNQDIYSSAGALTMWERERSADALLDRVKPDRVLLLFSSALNQVALRVAARDRGIETVHVEHGYRLPAAAALPIPTRTRAQDGARVAGWRTHAFFMRSLARRRPYAAVKLGRYAVDIARRGPVLDVQRAYASLRRPDAYISYSQECFAYHIDVDRIPKDTEEATRFVGVPQFDDFALLEQGPGKEALLIDHQFHEGRLFGWTQEFRHDWVRKIRRAVVDAGIPCLHVKLHPGDRSRAWEPYLADGRVRLAGREDLPGIVSRIGIVLGTFSTMQLPIVAQRHVAAISLEIHPDLGWFPSRRLNEAGVAEPVRSYSDLSDALADRGSILARQLPHKSAFTDHFLYRLDGRSGERLAEALLGLADDR